MPASASAAASSMRRRQGIGTKIVRNSGDVVRGALRREALAGLAEGRPWYYLSARKLKSNQSSGGSGPPAVSTSNTATTNSTTAVSSSCRQSHQPFTDTGDSPSGPPSVASSASAVSAGSSVSDQIRKLEGNRIRKLIEKNGFGFKGSNNGRGGGLPSSKADLSYVEWATASLGDGMPKKRSLDSWKDDLSIDDGIGGDERGAFDFRIPLIQQE